MQAALVNRCKRDASGPTDDCADRVFQIWFFLIAYSIRAVHKIPQSTQPVQYKDGISNLLMYKILTCV